MPLFFGESMIKKSLLAAALGLSFAFSAPFAFAQDATQRAPETATALQEKQGWAGRKYMVAAANPLAAEAGYQMLKKGGSAMDAAIATQLVLNLVEPQSSGIGGGAFIMHFDGKQVQAFDGRETAPASADEKLFQDASGQPLSRETAIIGGRSVGAPGVIRVMDMVHRQHGKLPWKVLFEPAIKLAEEGFAVSPRLNALLRYDQRRLQTDPTASAYLLDKDRNPWPVGHLLKNPALAATLREIANGGPDAFYKGRIARDIVTKVRSHATNPGLLTEQDLAGYQAKLRPAVCSDYRNFTVCGMPPPSSSGIAISQMLGVLETRDMARLAPVNGELTPDAVHLFTEAGRLAFADRNRYAADTDFAPLPGRGIAALIDKKYLAQRASLIGDKSMGVAPAGTPFDMKVAWGLDTAIEQPATSHIVAVDAQGNGVSMTTSVEDAFGSRQMVDGFMLNNHLTDFSFDSRDKDGPIANRVEGGKRPRSAMSPTLVFDKATKKLVLVVGSPGGPSIINYVAKVLVGTLDWGLNVQQAISLPNFGSRNGPTELEAGRAPQPLIDALKARGHTIRIGDQTSGLQGIMRLNIHGESMWFGGADPRREGVARGE
jgi:gamma-glutamyltranspeptidase/glutathione hydrolase